MAAVITTTALTLEEQLLEVLFKLYYLQSGSNAATTNPDNRTLITNISIGADGTISFSGSIPTTVTAPAGKPNYDPVEIFP
ncbi:MAG: hypothetical protein ACRC8A_13305 [Microcoleaceae cyanobacterium]